MLNRRFMTNTGILLIAALGVAACGGGQCSGWASLRECTMTAGTFDGFQIGMSKEAALERACEGTRTGEMSNWELITNDESQFRREASICRLGADAMAAQQWGYQTAWGLTSRTIFLTFEDERLTAIKIIPRGFTP